MIDVLLMFFADGFKVGTCWIIRNGSEIRQALLFLILRGPLGVGFLTTVFAFSAFRNVMGVGKLPSFDTGSSFFRVVRVRFVDGVYHVSSAFV